MAGAVIQATGRLIFEDGLRSFVEISGTEGSLCVRISPLNKRDELWVWGLPDESGIGDN